jgi:hypothetical protein
MVPHMQLSTNCGQGYFRNINKSLGKMIEIILDPSAIKYPIKNTVCFKKIFQKNLLSLTFWCYDKINNTLGKRLDILSLKATHIDSKHSKTNIFKKMYF